MEDDVITDVCSSTSGYKTEDAAKAALQKVIESLEQAGYKLVSSKITQDNEGWTLEYEAE